MAALGRKVDGDLYRDEDVGALQGDVLLHQQLHTLCNITQGSHQDLLVIRQGCSVVGVGDAQWEVFLWKSRRVEETGLSSIQVLRVRSVAPSHCPLPPFPFHCQGCEASAGEPCFSPRLLLRLKRGFQVPQTHPDNPCPSRSRREEEWALLWGICKDSPIAEPS